MVHVEFTPQALEDLAQRDSEIANRIAAKIQWFSEHSDHIQPETLTGRFAGLYKLRVGDWRVLYTIDPAEFILTVHVMPIAVRSISTIVCSDMESDSISFRGNQGFLALSSGRS